MICLILTPLVSLDLITWFREIACLILTPLVRIEFSEHLIHSDQLSYIDSIGKERFHWSLDSYLDNLSQTDFIGNNILCGITTATISKTITTITITTTTTTTPTSTIITTTTAALYFPYVLSFFFFFLTFIIIFFFSYSLISLPILFTCPYYCFISLAYMYHVFLTFYTVLYFPTFYAYIKVHDMAQIVY